MAGEDVQLSYAVEWLRAQAEETTAEPSTVPTQRAAAGWIVPLAALAGLAVWFGRR
jgi:carboxyl-terminal processing protease